jgi:hypothetical protein
MFLFVIQLGKNGFCDKFLFPYRMMKQTIENNRFPVLLLFIWEGIYE